MKDSTAYPAFFIAPAMNPRTVCFCHPMLCIISESVAPFLRCSMATTCAVLLPGHAAGISGTGADFLAVGAFLAVVAFLAGDGASYITATTIFADGGIMQSSPGL